MTTLTTKGQAACLVLGEPVTEANRVKCKAIVDMTPFDIVYTSERGKAQPIAIGKVVADRNPFTYFRYPDTPPPCQDDPSNIIETNDSSELTEGNSCTLDDVESSLSSCKLTNSSQVIKATKASVVDLLRIILTKHPASSIRNHYDRRSLTEQNIFDLVTNNISNAASSYTATQISKWLNADKCFGSPKSMRQGHSVIKARILWVLKPEFIGDAVDKIFNRKTFQRMIRKSMGWITVGYCRKSPLNETPQKRQELLQKMVNSLHRNDLCEKVFVSPICRASSDLLTRDVSPTTTAKSILKELRFHNGDMQDLLIFAKTTTLSVRLVLLDYAGLSTSPLDVHNFVKDIKSIQQVVIDHGHKLESLNRAKLTTRKIVSKFNCGKAPVKRSAL